MKLKDTRDEYYFHSGKVSEITRQLALAAIAVIWVFRNEAGGRPTIPVPLIIAGTFVLLCLGFDLLQYAVATRKWDNFNQQKEKELEKKRIADTTYDPEAEDFLAPEDINDLPKVLFWVKFVLVIVSYLILIFYLMTRVL